MPLRDQEAKQPANGCEGTRNRTRRNTSISQRLKVFDDVNPLDLVDRDVLVIEIVAEVAQVD